MEKLKTFDVDLKRLFFEVLKRLWLILLVGIICGASMFVYAKFFITPQYKATATIYIQNYTGDNDKKIYSSDLSASQNLVTTYQGLFTSDNVLNRVKEKLGDNYSADAIRAAFTAEAVEDTPILKISISDHDPEQAAKIVNEIAKVAPDAIMNLVEGSSVKVVDLSRVPTEISYPSYKKLALIGCVITVRLFNSPYSSERRALITSSSSLLNSSVFKSRLWSNQEEKNSLPPAPKSPRR